MKKGLVSGFKVAHKAKFTVEVYSTTSTLHLSERVCRNNFELSLHGQLTVSCLCFDVWELELSG